MNHQIKLNTLAFEQISNKSKTYEIRLYDEKRRKIKVGDKIEVIQSDNKFTYVVTETKVVEKNDISVLQDYSDYRITLITCSPLWTSKQRLVIVGKLDKLYKNT